ncbi:hypothetical protein MFIFM68171_02156 [Madurella fahalii]|uniref:ATPase AAA-type core domain-containing protein n=1 Tax=Madurella fahalii TaxID=1157608 RepID=A0ABQ0G2F0_9PEZI
MSYLTITTHYVTGYIRFWNEVDTHCDRISWISWPHDKIYLTTTLRRDINSLVSKLNGILRRAVEGLSRAQPGVYFVDEFEQKFDGHRFCEHKKDWKYHNNPIDPKTWFLHYNSPYQDPPAAGTSNGTQFQQNLGNSDTPFQQSLGSNGTLFQQVLNLLISPAHQ